MLNSYNQNYLAGRRQHDPQKIEEVVRGVVDSARALVIDKNAKGLGDLLQKLHPGLRKIALNYRPKPVSSAETLDSVTTPPPPQALCDLALKLLKVEDKLSPVLAVLAENGVFSHGIDLSDFNESVREQFSRRIRTPCC